MGGKKREEKKINNPRRKGKSVIERRKGASLPVALAHLRAKVNVFPSRFFFLSAFSFMILSSLFFHPFSLSLLILLRWCFFFGLYFCVSFSRPTEKGLVTSQTGESSWPQYFLQHRNRSKRK